MSSMYLATFSNHPHVKPNQVMTIVYKIHCLIQSMSITCASLFGSTMSSLVDPMTRDNLDTNIIVHDKNLIIRISSLFPSYYVMYHRLH